MIIVSKFGGSITANSENLIKAANIIKSNPDRCYVIASAPAQTLKDAGITNLLYMCHSSCSHKENYHEILNQISAHYSEIINGLEINFDLDAEIKALDKDLLSGKNLDFIGSRGEYIMGKIFASYLGWDFIDAAEIIFFNDDGTLNQEKTFLAANKRLKSLKHAVIPTFYGSMPNGEIKTFSRGDGDSSGAIIACAVNADLFEKWSETAKTYSADPAVIPDSEVIKNMTYSEAIELNYIGINIIIDSVLFMLRDSNIPLKICSINDPDYSGMLISANLPENISRGAAMCIAGRRNFDVIHIEKYGLNKEFGFGEKLFGLFASHHVPCEHCLSSIYKMSVVIKNLMFNLRYKEVISDIKKLINPDSITVEKNLSLIAVIGQGMGTVYGKFEKIFAALAGAHINVRMIDQGSDDLNIIIGVADEDYNNAVKALYENVIIKKDE